MMNRTPDEIKKGLRCCVQSICQCADDCPYKEEYGSVGCWVAMNKDALAYIQQLESDKQQLEGMLHHMNQLRDAAAGRALKMEERVHQLEAERDAALETIYEMAECITEDVCEWCDGVECERLCMQHTILRPGFKWRGVQKEE